MKPTPPPASQATSAAILIAAMCLAQVLGMLGAFAFPALLPHFIEIWDLSNSRAGWISGIYFGGYASAVPVLTSLTDRIDSRKIYLFSCLICLASNLGFAFFSSGFWSALIFRTLCGIGLAGTFIPGLKAVIDRVAPRFIHRAVSFYTACFGLGMSLSFYYAGTVFKWLGWEPVFVIAAACSGLVLLMSAGILVPCPVEVKTKRYSGLLELLDFRPVWRNTPARTYIIAYMCHMWEMFAARSWMVVFLAFAAKADSDSELFMIPTTVMAVGGICGMAASILFGEIAVKFGRRRTVAAIMAASGLTGLSLGFLGALPYPVLVCFCLLYTVFFQGDSAAIHTGVVTAADPNRRGAAMALQSMGGFAAASLSPIVAGFVLDISGGSGLISWGLTFGIMGIAAFLGLFFLYWHFGES
ncbi:MAG TPA: MFS transporter [Desulfobacteraceae bacterium]|nr:MFS transporter [Desulfobacteraceae bacterium]